MKVKLRDLKPNPFRNMKAYPISEEKIRELENSIRETGFWENIVARKKGKFFQIAYGHHRLEALCRKYPPDKEFDFIIKNLSDEMMIKMMANENSEYYACLPSVVDETVKSAKDFLEKNRGVARKILSSEMSENKKKRRLKIGAPVIAKFLGDNWSRTKVEESLARIKMIENGIVSAKALYKFSTLASAINFARSAKELDVDLEKQEEVADDLISTGLTGKRAMLDTMMTSARLSERKWFEALDPNLPDYFDRLLAKFTSRMKRVNKETEDLFRRLENPQLLLFGGKMTAGDLRHDTVKKFFETYESLKEIADRAMEFVKNIPEAQEKDMERLENEGLAGKKS